MSPSKHPTPVPAPLDDVRTDDVRPDDLRSDVVRSDVVHPDELWGQEFHRLGRGVSGRGWRPLLTLLLGAAIYLGALVLVVLVWALVALGAGTDLVDRAWSLDLTDPYAFVNAFALIALMLPSVLLARRVVGPGGRGWVGRC